jgi:hypothetical protein
MAFRSGYLWSHWYQDQNHLVMYSKGAALLPSQPYAYYTSPLPEFSQYNDIRFGDSANVYHYGWPDSNILAHFFGQRVQYAWSSTTYPAWYITPGVTPGFGDPPKLREGLGQKEGEFTWNRQIAFLVGKTAKSPNYFVIRDTMAGEGKLAQWFGLNVLGRKGDVQVQPDALHVNTEWPTKLDVFFPGQAITPELTEEDPLLDLLAHYYGPTWAAAVKGKSLSPNWKRKDGKPLDPEKRIVPDQEQHVLVRIPAAAGADHFWLAYPRGAGEAAPAVKRLAPHVVKVTHAEGTDYILLAPAHTRYSGEGITLEGTAAAVRVGREDVTLAILTGTGAASYGKALITGLGPVENTFAHAVIPEVNPRVYGGIPSAIPPYTPTLAGHQPLGDGVKKAANGTTTEYLVDAPTAITTTDGAVTMEARKAAIQITPVGIRFVVPERTYVKLTVGTVGVRGTGPFDLTLTDAGITGTVDGEMRTIVATMPKAIIRPMYHLDGTRWYAGYPDDPAPYRGRQDPQFGLAFAVHAGKHQVEIREWASPALPPAPAMVEIAVK